MLDTPADLPYDLAEDAAFVYSNVEVSGVEALNRVVNRAGLPLEQLGTEPARTGASLRDVLAFFP